MPVHTNKKTIAIITQENITIDILYYDLFTTRVVHDLMSLQEHLQNTTCDAVIITDIDLADELQDFIANAIQIWPWLHFFSISDTELSIPHLQTLNKSDDPEKTLRTLAHLLHTETVDNCNEKLSFFADFVQICNTSLHQKNLWNASEVLGSTIIQAFEQTTFLQLKHDHVAQLLVTGAPLKPNVKNNIIDEIVKRYAFMSPSAELSAKDIYISEQTTEEFGTDTFIKENLISIPQTNEHGVNGALFFYFPPVHEQVNNIPSRSIARQISDMLQLITHYNDRGYHDTLTGLYNHDFLIRKGKTLWEKYNPVHQPIGAIVLDIDYFKTFNNSYGHDIGDRIIYELAQLIKSVIKHSDIPSRCGGDEIIIILPETNTNGCRAIARRLLQIVRDFEFKAAGKPMRFSVSIGIATTEDTSIKNVSELISQANQAMFLAKESGRNQFCDTQEFANKSHNDKQSENPNASKGRLLVVDDDQTIVALLKDIFEIAGYSVDFYTDSQDALDAVFQSPEYYDVILSDIQMPKLTGLELLSEVQKISPHTVGIIITGCASTENTIGALRAGVYNFIQKPFDIDEVCLIIEHAVERCTLKRQIDQYRTNLETILAEKTLALNEALSDLKVAYFKTMEAIIRILDAHENEMADHSQRVSVFSVHLAKEMGITSEETLRTIKHGALLHDIGKIGIPNTMLHKPGKLTDEEWKLMRTHTEIGYNIVKTIPTMEDVAEMVYSHHEKYSGGGYPRDLKGHNICLPARIFAVIDAFDALRSNRSYQSAQTLETIVNEINRCSGTHFDPKVVEAFNRCYKVLDKLYPSELDKETL